MTYAREQGLTRSQHVGSLLVIAGTVLIDASLCRVLILYISSFHGDTTFLHSKSVPVKQCENKATSEKWLTLDITKQHSPPAHRTAVPLSGVNC